MKIRIRGFYVVSFISLLFGTALQPVSAATYDALGKPVKAVLSRYQKIDQALTKDSLDQVAQNAREISKLVRDDQGKTLALSVAERAEKLSQATDLKAARKAFKPLSEGLIDYLAQTNVKSTGLEEIYCPMAEAAWLQKAGTIQNPYLGKSMPDCGEVKRKF